MANEDLTYILWLSRLPCSMCGSISGPPHHPRHNVGLALRAHDHRAVPICYRCHEDLHRLSGRFRGWTRDRLRAWLDDLAVTLREQYRKGVEKCESSDQTIPI